ATAPAPWAPQGPSRTWYLAEGCACPPFDTSFLITNPHEAKATVTARFMKEDGASLDGQYQVPARSRLRVPPLPEAAGAAFSTVIDSDQPVFVQRFISMALTGRLASGVNAPSRAWFLAEGRTGEGFDTWLLLMNPNAEPAKATITFFVENGGPIEQSYYLLPTSRLSLYVNWLLPFAAFGVRVEASQPIVVERAMYFAEGGSHGAMGSTLASNTWYLPDVDTRPGTDSWVLIANPNAQAASLTLALVTDQGATVKGSYSVPASSRLTLYANEIMPRASGFATVQADLPVVVARSTYWMGGRAGYSSPGVPATARSWSFAQAIPPAPSQELLSAVNPGPNPARLIVSFLVENGDTLGNTYNVAPGSRLVLDPKAVAPPQALTMNLESDVPVAVERAVYPSR
ncbi:MAG: hypothetical protein Q8O76_08900, partial [Chloroflexota bacterium]|nr:hypothetical protein [Chloroflexota bacterium]